MEQRSFFIGILVMRINNLIEIKQHYSFLKRSICFFLKNTCSDSDQNRQPSTRCVKTHGSVAKTLFIYIAMQWTN
jgi:hypothetical protein